MNRVNVETSPIEYIFVYYKIPTVGNCHNFSGGSRICDGGGEVNSKRE